MNPAMRKMNPTIKKVKSAMSKMNPTLSNRNSVLGFELCIQKLKMNLYDFITCYEDAWNAAKRSG